MSIDLLKFLRLNVHLNVDILGMHPKPIDFHDSFIKHIIYFFIIFPHCLQRIDLKLGHLTLWLVLMRTLGSLLIVVFASEALKNDTTVGG